MMTEPPMINVLLLQAVLVLISLGLLAVLWLQWTRSGREEISEQNRSREQDLERDRENLKLYQQTELELRQQLERGEIDESEFQQLLAEAQEELLDNVDADKPVSENEKTDLSGRFKLGIAFGLLFVSLSAAMWLYFPQGLSLGADDQAELRMQITYLQEAQDQDAWIGSANKVTATLAGYINGSDLRSDEHQQMASLYAQISSGLGNYSQALLIYTKLLEANPDDVFLKINKVESGYFLRSSLNQRPFFTPDMSGDLDSVLKAQPDIPIALSLRGTAAFEQENYPQAVEYWERALALLPPHSTSASQLSEGVRIARSRLGGDGAVALNDSAQVLESSEGQSAPEAYIDVLIDIDRSQLLDSDSSSTAVFVFARPASGPRMPLAAKRLQLADLPTRIRLSEVDRMAAMSMMDFDEVAVAARLSRSGSPIGQSGDLESETLVVTVTKAQSPDQADTDPVKLVIKQLL